VMYEYLLFNVVVAAGPFAFSFERNVRFYKQWRHAFPAIALAALPFLVWDIIVTGRHWDFNPAFTHPGPVFGLPLGEWLFFFSVPFAALFVWEVLRFYVKSGSTESAVSALLLAIGGWLLLQGLEYTGLALSALSGVFILERLLRTALFSRREFPFYLAFLAVATVLFNGYLTARPVVFYNETYMSGWRLGTIPVEDFVYGTALILLATTLYEWLKRRTLHA
jgi:lycopene cyclase domain-containing protein